MPDGYGAAGFGAGIAEGIASAFGRRRQNDLEDERAHESRRQQTATALISHALQNPDQFPNPEELTPYFDIAMGTAGKKYKKGEINPHDILQQVLAPNYSGRGAAAGATAGGEPPVTDAVASPAGGTADQVASTGAPALPSAATPAVGAPDRPSIGGVHLRSHDEQVQQQIHDQEAISEAQTIRQTKQARDFYQQFRALDKDFTMRDALRMAGFNVDINRSVGGGGSLSQFGSLGAFLAKKQAEKAAGGDDNPLTSDEFLEARTAYYAANRSAGVNNDTISRAEFGGKAFNLQDPPTQEKIIQRVTQLIGQQSYSRTAGGNQADYAAPITPVQSATTELPVGTTGPQLEGQQIPTAADRDSRRGTQTMLDQIANIKTLLGVLPKKGDLGEYLPGAAIAIAKRDPAHRAEFAKLEAAVDTLVGNAARNLQQQRGAQTEKDAERAYNAAVDLKTSMWDPARGDTQESALERLGQTETLAKTVLSRLPAMPVPTKPGARKAQPGAAPYTLTYTAADGSQKTATFESQAKLDQAKRALGIK